MLVGVRLLTARRSARTAPADLRGSKRHIYAATYGEPPDPPATALLAALTEAATSAPF